MELMQEVKGYSDREEEEEEAEITREEINSSSKHSPLIFSPSLSSSSPSTNHHSYPHHQNLWLGLHDHYQSPEVTTPTDSHNSTSGLGLHQGANHRKLEFMDLSMGNEEKEANFHGGVGTSSTTAILPIKKEHMFDKVVTPSDVGKLNRLVIPKQHAEKYFPLDSSSSEKGLLLNFEDRNGKLWRFRYSYWNSSQSYVMTKGWSRFVKEKKLDAGDTVSFQRGAGELYRHRLYIDWRRRPDHRHHHGSDPTLITPFLLPDQPSFSQYSIRWGGRLYSLPPGAPAAASRHHNREHLQQVNYTNMYPFHQRRHQYHSESYHQSYNELNLRSGSVYCLRSTTPTMSGRNLMGQQEGGNSPMIIDSVPVAHHHHHHSSSSSIRTEAKRLRLFGVNMECASSSSSSSPVEEPKCCLLSSTSANLASSLPSSSLQYLMVPHEEDPLSSSSTFQNQKRETSMLFDLDPSLQYRQ